MKPPVVGPRCASILAAAVLAAGSTAVRAGDATGVAGVPPVLASELAAEPAAAALSSDVASLRPEEPAGSESGLAPGRWLSSAEPTAHGYRMSLSRGALDLALHFETPASRVRPLQAIPDPVGPAVPVLPTLSFGLREGAPASAGSLLERSTGAHASDNYVSKVGVEWKPAESRVNFLREGLGIRLEGNDRMTVRLRKGVIGVYMHRKF